MRTPLQNAVCRPSRRKAALGLASALAACASGARASGDVERLEIVERVAVDDASLYLEVRGNGRAPLLLWLHGGPGGAERPLFRYFNGGLEESFLVAYLDQRGAGRSFDAHAATSRLTVAQHLVDLDAVVDHLRLRFERDRIVLIGHSWGGALGLLYAHAHPEKLSELICAAPVVAVQEQWRREYAFDLEEANRRVDRRAMAELGGIGPPPYGNAEQVLRVQRITQRFGGVEHRPPNHLAILASGAARGLVTPWELARFFRGNSVSLAAMHVELSRLDLRANVPELAVPVRFFLGRYDRHVDAELSHSYFSELRAPEKHEIWFEQSAHDIPFEEPDAFNAAVIASARAGE